MVGANIDDLRSSGDIRTYRKKAEFFLGLNGEEHPQQRLWRRA
jgi:hypothetical protein